MLKNRLAFFLAAAVLAGCASKGTDVGSGKAGNTAARTERTEKGDAAHAVSSASTYDAYKRDLAQRIAQQNATRVYGGRPQALLRSVVVLRYAVDGRGNLLKSEVLRSNHDRETEATALATLRNSAPFPQPAPHLLQRGRIEISETWLFNNDGRFQLRTIAQPQEDS